MFGGVLAGRMLRLVLPEDHLGPDSREMVKLGMGLIGTMSALVLGLLVASAKSHYDEQKAELTGLTAKVAFLDQLLDHYGPDTKAARELLRTAVALGIDQIWEGGRKLEPDKRKASSLYNLIRDLAPGNETQRSLQAQASTLAVEIRQTRVLMYAQRDSSISMPLLVVLVFWLTINLLSFGLLAPRNRTMTTMLFVCALSVSGAIFLIQEMDGPFSGLIQISKAPLHELAEQLGK